MALSPDPSYFQKLCEGIGPTAASHESKIRNIVHSLRFRRARSRLTLEQPHSISLEQSGFVFLVAVRTLEPLPPTIGRSVTKLSQQVLHAHFDPSVTKRGFTIECHAHRWMVGLLHPGNGEDPSKAS